MFNLKAKMADESGAISTVEMIIIISLVMMIAFVVFKIIGDAVKKQGQKVGTRIDGIELGKQDFS